MIKNSNLILEHVPNDGIEEKIKKHTTELNFRPSRIDLKQKIVDRLYIHKKYFLD